MEGLTSWRRHKPGWEISDHLYAGANAAWLAARGWQEYAHVRLFGTRPFTELDRQWRISCNLRLRAAHPLAVRWQGWPHGTAAKDSRARRNSRHGRQLSSAPAGRGDWLCRWRGKTGAHR